MNASNKERHIVFAESEQGLERSISLTLKMADYKVTVVADCLDAYEKIVELAQAKEMPDLLIIDFGRKTENGERFVQGLSNQNLHLPLIVISEYGDERLVGQSLAEQSVLFISKPFEPQELICGIEKVLEV